MWEEALDGPPLLTSRWRQAWARSVCVGRGSRMLPALKRTFLPLGLLGPPPRASCPIVSLPLPPQRAPPLRWRRRRREQSHRQQGCDQRRAGLAHGSLVMVICYVHVLEASPLLWKRPLPHSQSMELGVDQLPQPDCRLANQRARPPGHCGLSRDGQTVKQGQRNAPLGLALGFGGPGSSLPWGCFARES